MITPWWEMAWLLSSERRRVPITNLNLLCDPIINEKYHRRIKRLSFISSRSFVSSFQGCQPERYWTNGAIPKKTIPKSQNIPDRLKECFFTARIYWKMEIEILITNVKTQITLYTVNPSAGALFSTEIMQKITMTAKKNNSCQNLLLLGNEMISLFIQTTSNAALFS